MHHSNAFRKQSLSTLKSTFSSWHYSWGLKIQFWDFQANLMRAFWKTYKYWANWLYNQPKEDNYLIEILAYQSLKALELNLFSNKKDLLTFLQNSIENSESFKKWNKKGLLVTWVKLLVKLLFHYRSFPNLIRECISYLCLTNYVSHHFHQLWASKFSQFVQSAIVT